MTEFFELAPDGYLITDSEAVIGVANPAAAALLGRERERLIGTSLRAFLAEGSKDDLARFLARFREGHLALEGKFSLRPKSGGQREAKVTARRDGGGDGGLTALHWVLHDVTEHEQRLRRLEYLAYHDQLTGLGNRRMLLMRLRQAIARARRSGRGVAVVYLDLDRFKLINDHLGHRAGDELLRLIGSRLRSVSREAEMIGRLGGDEFLLVIEDLEVRDREGNHRIPPEPELAARRILKALEMPYEMGGIQIYVSASLGLSVYPIDGEDVNSLIERADAGVYTGKRRALGHPLFAAVDPGALSEFGSLKLVRSLGGRGGSSWSRGQQNWKGRARWPEAEADAKTIVESDFPPVSEAVGMARAASEAALNGHSQEVVDSVVLLVSELMTNSIMHAGLPTDGSISLVIRILSNRLRVEVTDGGHGIRRSDLSPDPDPGQGHGLGLLLLDRLSTAWGTHSDPAGVWFEIASEVTAEGVVPVSKDARAEPGGPASLRSGR